MDKRKEEQMERMQQAVQSAQNKADAIISYGAGGGIIGISLADIATTAQSVGIILGCLVVAVRLVHDGLNLWKTHFKKK